jgi:phosphinothricin acetyltransferase
MPEVRRARPDDAEAIATIFEQGIADGIATFETTPPDAAGWAARIASERERILVAVAGGEVIAWAAAGPYTDDHAYYEGVREATMYVGRGYRRRGIGGVLLDALAAECEADGAHKLIGKIMAANPGSVALCESRGFRRVGVHRRHGRLHGEWQDVVVVERLLGDARDP